MLKRYKQFVLRGNVIDMAVGVVVGEAFAAVVAALTKGLLTPLISALIGKPDFSAIRFTVNGSIFALGDFINSPVSFLLVAVTLCFLVIVPVNAITTKGSKLIRTIFADHPRELEHAFSFLDNSEKEVLRRLLRKMGEKPGVQLCRKLSEKLIRTQFPSRAGRCSLIYLRFRSI